MFYCIFVNFHNSPEDKVEVTAFLGYLNQLIPISGFVLIKRKHVYENAKREYYSKSIKMN